MHVGADCRLLSRGDDLTCLAGELHKKVPKREILRSQEGLLSKQLALTSAQAPMLFLYN